MKNFYYILFLLFTPLLSALGTSKVLAVSVDSIKPLPSQEVIQSLPTDFLPIESNSGQVSTSITAEEVDPTQIIPENTTSTSSPVALSTSQTKKQAVPKTELVPTLFNIQSQSSSYTYPSQDLSIETTRRLNSFAGILSICGMLLLSGIPAGIRNIWDNELDQITTGTLGRSKLTIDPTIQLD